MIERLPSPAGRLDEDGELLPQHYLARETIETAWPQRSFYLLVVDELPGVGKPICRQFLIERREAGIVRHRASPLQRPQSGSHQDVERLIGVGVAQPRLGLDGRQTQFQKGRPSQAEGTIALQRTAPRRRSSQPE